MSVKKLCLPTSVFLLLVSVGGFFIVAQESGPLLPPPTQGPVYNYPGYPGYPVPVQPLPDSHWSPLMTLFVITSALTTISTVFLAFYQGVLKIRQEAQSHISTLNNQAITALGTTMAANTVETVKSAHAADQVKQRVEQLEQKLPIKQSEADTPMDESTSSAPRV